MAEQNNQQKKGGQQQDANQNQQISSFRFVMTSYMNYRQMERTHLKSQNMT